MARKPIPLPVPFEIPEEQECPKCPPVGSPPWMATFADIATLLMAFFVLILSFAEFNQPKFKMVAGSLKNAFGVQREVPVVEQPKGTTVLELNFSPSPEMSVTKELTQDTTEREAPEIKTPATQDDGQGTGTDGEASALLAQTLEQQLEAMTEQPQLSVEVQNGEVVLKFRPSDEANLSDQLHAAADALEQTAQTTGQSVDDVLVEGLTNDIDTIADAVEEQQENEKLRIAEGQSERSAAIAEAELRVALRQEVAQGLVSIEQRQEKVIVTVGAGGAFPSGVADLTPEAKDVMARLAFAAMSDASDIVVTGHTDSIPLTPSSPYRDNWGLAAARASSVVRALTGSGLVEPDRLTAVSRGETMPVMDNADAQGREDNRRIEIEINY